MSVVSIRKGNIMKAILFTLVLVTVASAHTIIRSFDAPDTDVRGIARTEGAYYGDAIYAISGNDSLYKLDPLTGAVLEIYPPEWSLDRDYRGMVQYGDLYVLAQHPGGGHSVYEISLIGGTYWAMNGESVGSSGEELWALGQNSYGPSPHGYGGWASGGSEWYFHGTITVPRTVPFAEAYGATACIPGLGSYIITAVACEPYGPDNTVISFIDNTPPDPSVYNITTATIPSAQGISTDSDVEDAIWVHSPVDNKIYLIGLENMALQHQTWATIKSQF